MTKPELKSSDAIGCGMFVLALLTTLPIWYVLLYGLLVRTNAPEWHWVMFWIYIPFGIFLKTSEYVLRCMKEKGH